MNDMINYGKYSKSVAQKIFLLTLEVGFILLGWIVVKAGSGDNLHKSLLILADVLIFVFYIPTITVFVRRDISWKEAVNVSFAFGFYYVGFPYLGRNGRAGVSDIVGLLLILTGLTIHLVSEYQRYKFKKTHPGELMTGGLWSLSRHINYFGDLVWATGFAVMTGNPISFVIPGLLFVFFYFFNIPLLEKYLENRYGEKFREYRKKTRALIPYIL